VKSKVVHTEPGTVLAHTNFQQVLAIECLLHTAYARTGISKEQLHGGALRSSGKTDDLTVMHSEKSPTTGRDPSYRAQGREVSTFIFSPSLSACLL
jgi:hypothetical protein